MVSNLVCVCVSKTWGADREEGRIFLNFFRGLLSVLFVCFLKRERKGKGMELGGCAVGSERR